MKILAQTYLFLYLFSIPAFSKTVVIPEENFPLEQYYSVCKKEGYQCIEDFMFDNLLSMTTPKMNQLLERLDITDTQQRKNLYKDILQIVKSEMISRNQLESLRDILDKSIEFEPRQDLINLKKQFDLILKYLDDEAQNASIETTSTKDSLVLFKIKISNLTYEKIKKTYIPILTLNLSPYYWPYSGKFKKPILKGTCEAPQIKIENPSDNYLVPPEHWTPLYNDDCSFSKTFKSSLSSSKTFVRENKNWLISGAILAASFFLLKNYDVEFK